MKIKILILNEPENINGVTWWRMYEPMRLLEQMYPDQVEIIWNRGVILPVDMLRADVAIAWRPSTAAQLAAVAMIRQQQIPIIADFDDDLINVPSGSPAFNAYFQGAADIRKIVSMCDSVWTSTEPLKQVYQHQNTTVIPNAVLPHQIAENPNPITKTVVWRGDYNQYEDVYAAYGQYQSIIKKCQNFIWCGYMPTWEHPENTRYMPWTSLEGYWKFLNRTKPNFIWKPMRKRVQFCLGKSNISKLEAICAGAVCLTNFYDMPTWEHSFREITWDEKQIHGAWEAGRDQVLREYNLEEWTHVRYKSIYDVANGIAPRSLQQPFTAATGVY